MVFFRHSYEVCTTFGLQVSWGVMTIRKSSRLRCLTSTMFDFNPYILSWSNLINSDIWQQLKKNLPAILLAFEEKKKRLWFYMSQCGSNQGKCLQGTLKLYHAAMSVYVLLWDSSDTAQQGAFCVPIIFTQVPHWGRYLLISDVSWEKAWHTERIKRHRHNHTCRHVRVLIYSTYLHTNNMKP